MKIRHISVRNFRGIRELDWAINSDMVCLIGPSNSCKSTVLDAIERALSPRWNLAFTDDDFYHGNTGQPIVIQVTLGQLPKKLLSEAAFGLYARGWRKKEQSIVDEPTDDAEIVLTIQLKVDASLEPEWRVIADRHAEGKPVSARNRELLGMSSLGGYVDRDLSWARGSVLTRVSTGQESIGSMLAEASRSIRKTVSDADLAVLADSARRIGEDARQAGVAIGDDLRPDLDLRSVGLTSSVLCLFDGDVPLRQSGLGVRRLATLVMRKQLTEDGAILLVDELEHGLQPFRVRQLVRYLRPDDGELHQVFCCTHSPIALVEHQANEVHVVRVDSNGKVIVRQAGSNLQRVLRALGEALFCTKIVLCEGNTEWGFARALEEHWIERGREPIAYLNAAFAYAPGASGSSMSGYARDIAALGYETAFWCDADVELQPSVEELAGCAVRVVQWGECLAIEQRIHLDVPVACLDELLQLACKTAKGGEQSVRDAISARIASAPRDFASVSELIQSGCAELIVRRALGDVAKDKGWFKSTEAGEALGRIVVKYLDRIPATDTALKIAQLGQWLYG